MTKIDKEKDMAAPSLTWDPALTQQGFFQPGTTIPADYRLSTSFPGGLDPSVSDALSKTNSMNTAFMWGSFGAAVVNAVGQAYTSTVLANAQINHWKVEGQIADIQKDISLGALNAQEKKMQVTADLTPKRNAVKEERVKAEADLKMVKTQLKEEKKTREYGDVDLKKLNAAFARNDRFYGKPLAQISA